MNVHLKLLLYSSLHGFHFANHKLVFYVSGSTSALYIKSFVYNTHTCMHTHKHTHTHIHMDSTFGFPSGAVVKNLPANAGDERDVGLISGPWIKKILWSRK